MSAEIDSLASNRESLAASADKIACFCFQQQVLQPGETVQMPVTFYVDPDMLQDRDGKYVNQITLSYTFYSIDLPETAALATAPAQAATN